MIMFHAGCNGCTKQKTGVYGCKKCQYFAADWSLPSLNNRPLTETEKIREEIQKGTFIDPYREKKVQQTRNKINNRLAKIEIASAFGLMETVYDMWDELAEQMGG